MASTVPVYRLNIGTILLEHSQPPEIFLSCHRCGSWAGASSTHPTQQIVNIILWKIGGHKRSEAFKQGTPRQHQVHGKGVGSGLDIHFKKCDVMLAAANIIFVLPGLNRLVRS